MIVEMKQKIWSQDINGFLFFTFWQNAIEGNIFKLALFLCIDQPANHLNKQTNSPLDFETYFEEL